MSEAGEGQTRSKPGRAWVRRVLGLLVGALGLLGLAPVSLLLVVGETRPGRLAGGVAAGGLLATACLGHMLFRSPARAWPWATGLGLGLVAAVGLAVVLAREAPGDRASGVSGLVSRSPAGPGIPRFSPFRLVPEIDQVKLGLTLATRFVPWVARARTIREVTMGLYRAIFVAFHYKTFYAKLPDYQKFFAFQTMLYMWIALGVVKVIHEFGHGLSCKAFGGESHEMGFLFMCFSPALYCNVTDSWTVADKWKRIIISFAGIWVELIIASLATFVWWYTPHWPFVNNVSLCIMVLCSISTFVFNANPLMRFDGYYILADWLEVPNLRERANRYIMGIAQEKCFGIEVPPEQYMAITRKTLFIAYAVASWFYRWFVTVGILLFLASWLKPYKLETLSVLLAVASLASMIFWPAYRTIKNIRQRGRLPDMKRKRAAVSALVLAALVLAFFYVPLPVSRVRERGLVQIAEGCREYVYVREGGILSEVMVYDGQEVRKGTDLARFRNPRMEFERQRLESEMRSAESLVVAIEGRLSQAPSDLATRSRAEKDLNDARNEFHSKKSQFELMERLIAENEILKAPRAGIAMSIPKKEELFKSWDKGESPPFCTIGDLKQLRLLVPVNAVDYRELKQNLEKARLKNPDDAYLEVSILPKNRRDMEITGRVSRVPDTDEKNVPVALTHQGGGSLATKAGGDPNVNQPLAQTYLIPVDVIGTPEQLATIAPGTIAVAKIHMEWRSLGVVDLAGYCIGPGRWSLVILTVVPTDYAACFRRDGWANLTGIDGDAILANRGNTSLGSEPCQTHVARTAEESRESTGPLWARRSAA